MQYVFFLFNAVRINAISGNSNKEMRGIMIGPNKGRLRTIDSEMITAKLQEPCQGQQNIIAHR